MKSWKDNLTNLTPYEPGEQSDGGDVIKLNANENPYPPSSAVSYAIKNFDYKELRKYPPLGDNRLKSVIADYYNIDTENVLTGNSSDEVLAMCFRAFFNTDQPVLFPDITYSFYPVWCDFFELNYRTIPLADDFRVKIDDYHIQNGGIVIPNPNAPTGIEMDIDLIDSLADSNRQSVVIIDEAYADFGEVSAVELTKKYDNLLVVRTVSKSRSLAGLRVGYALGNPQLIKVLEAAMYSFNAYPLSSLSISAAAASFEDEGYFVSTVSKIKTTRDRIKNQLSERGFTVTDSGANFLFLTHNNGDAEDIYKYMSKNGILIRHFKKDRISDHLRVSIGTDDEMKAFLDTLDSYLEENNAV